MTAPSPARPAWMVEPTGSTGSTGGRHARVPEPGAPPGPTVVVPRPRIQGPVPVAVRPLGPPPPRPLPPHPLPPHPARLGPPPAGLHTASVPGLYGPPPATGGTSGSAVTSFVLALVALPSALASVLLTLVLALTAVTLGVIGLCRTSGTGVGGRGLAVAGLAIGGVLLVLGASLLVFGLLGALG